MVAIALKCPFCGSEDVRVPRVFQRVKSGMPVIIRHVPIKHVMQNTDITAVSLR
jgi:hypothetical protein